MEDKCVNQRMSQSEIRNSIIKFSGPVIAELMLMSMLSIVNLSMVGHLGAYALSSIGITNQPVFISLAVFQSFNIGATALISRFIGAKDYKKVKVVVIQTIIMSIILGIILSLVGFIFAKQIVIFMGAKTDTIESGTMCMKYMAIGMVFQSIPTAIASILRGAGESKLPMIYNIISNIINIILGYVLINGFYFFPKLGLEGAVIGTTVAKVVACILSLYAIMNCKLQVKVTFKDRYRLDFKIIKRIMNIGLSAAGEQISMRIGFVIYTMIIAKLGTSAFASHQICISISGLASNFVNGLSIAASSFTGRSLGAKDPKLAEEYCDQMRKIGLIISVILGFVFFFFGYQISLLFTKESDVLILSASVLKVAAFITISQNYGSIISGALRGAGDTKYTFYSAIISMVMARITLAFLFVNVFHLGLEGAWAAAVVDQTVRAIFMYYRYKSGKWKDILV